MDTTTDTKTKVSKKVSKKAKPNTKPRKLNYTPRHFSSKIAEPEWLKMTQNELKQTCVRLGLRVGGTKPALVDRIRAHLAKDAAMIRIQKLFRGFVARETIRLKGPGLRNHKICVNDCDFYSLDTLNEIPDYQFFSYRDARGFVYAFDLFSLMTMFAKNRKIENPYNREEVQFSVICDIFSLFKKTLLYHPRSELASLNKKNLTPINQQEPNEATRLVLAADRLRELRDGRTAVERVVQAFMEIDNLGNYTDHRWFVDLSPDHCMRFYRNYFTFWTGNQLPLDVRGKICAVANPFSRINLVDIQMKCIELIEWMVYTGIDTEHRTLGALHVLSMLTTVSIQARRSLPWLSI